MKEKHSFIKREYLKLSSLIDIENNLLTSGGKCMQGFKLKGIQTFFTHGIKMEQEQSFKSKTRVNVYKWFLI